MFIYPISAFDKAVELVARKRAAGQRTRDLLECATASLDSPCTALWSQVLNEVRAEANLTAGMACGGGRLSLSSRSSGLVFDGRFWDNND